jgi:hypothetical protein
MQKATLNTQNRKSRRIREKDMWNFFEFNRILEDKTIEDQPIEEARDPNWAKSLLSKHPAFKDLQPKVAQIDPPTPQPTTPTPTQAPQIPQPSQGAPEIPAVGDQAPPDEAPQIDPNAFNRLQAARTAKVARDPKITIGLANGLLGTNYGAKVFAEWAAKNGITAEDGSDILTKMGTTFSDKDVVNKRMNTFNLFPKIHVGPSVEAHMELDKAGRRAFFPVVFDISDANDEKTNAKNTELLKSALLTIEKSDIPWDKTKNVEEDNSDMGRILSQWGGNYEHREKLVKQGDEWVPDPDAQTPLDKLEGVERTAASLASELWRHVVKLPDRFMDPMEMGSELLRKAGMQGKFPGQAEAAVVKMIDADKMGQFNNFLYKDGRLAVNRDVMGGFQADADREGSSPGDKAKISNVAEVPAGRERPPSGPSNLSVADTAAQDARLQQGSPAEGAQAFIQHMQKAIDTGSPEDIEAIKNMVGQHVLDYAKPILQRWASEGGMDKALTARRMKRLQQLAMQEECFNQVLEWIEEATWGEMHDLMNRWD